MIGGVPHLVAKIRGKRRSEFITAIGSDRVPILTALCDRVYRIDTAKLTADQVRWLVDQFGVFIPVGECTISVEVEAEK